MRQPVNIEQMTDEKTPSRRPRNLLRANQGNAAIEFGLFAPLLLVLFLGIVEVGRVLQHHHVIVKGMRDAGRYLSRVDDPNDATSQTVARNLAMRASIDGSAPLLLYYWNDPTSVDVNVATFDNSAGKLRGGATIPLVTVTANVSYGGSIFPGWLFSALTLTASHQERHIGE